MKVDHKFENYSADNIQVLEGLEAVRKRLSMYIGSTCARGLHHLVYEVVDNSIDEALGGHCKDIIVNINADGSISVEDDGRGIPVDIHEKTGKPALEVVMTIFYVGGKFDKDSYSVSGGLHGVGVSVVNALSAWLEVRVKRNGKLYFQRFEWGKKVTELQEIGTSEKTGTIVTFMPDSEIFETVTMNYDILANRIRELAFLNSGIKIVLTDLREENKSNVFQYEGGIVSFVEYLNKGKTLLNEKPIYFKKEVNEVVTEIAFVYNDGYNEIVQTLSLIHI